MTIALPDAPTGADLVAAIGAVADVLGIAPVELTAPLSKYPASWLKQTAEAKRPRPDTIARVRALLAGQPVPAPPANTLQARNRVRAIQEEAAEEARQRMDRLRQAQTLSGTVFIDAEQTLRERRHANSQYRPPAGERAQVRATPADDLAARIDRDQAARRAERERWLDIEQQRYGLTRRGRLPDDMPA
jgi:hypothetical protein